MDSFDLTSLQISQGEQSRQVPFDRAKLVVVTEYGSRLWYIDLDGVADEEMLQHFANTDDIAVTLQATTIGGNKMTGRGYFHPNVPHGAAAIRGEGVLEGFAANRG
jgi:hypothetical protein